MYLVPTTVGTEGQEDKVLCISRMTLVHSDPSYDGKPGYDMYFCFEGEDEEYVARGPLGNWCPFYRIVNGVEKSDPRYCIGVGWWDMDSIYHKAEFIEKDDRVYGAPPRTIISTKGSIVPPATLCYNNKWKVGDKLSCKGGKVIKITAIGKEQVLVDYGDGEVREGMWHANGEEWFKVP